MISRRMVNRGLMLAPLLGQAAVARAQSAAKPVITLKLGDGILSLWSLYVGTEKGYFTDAGIDLKLNKAAMAGTIAMPMLARGDLDLLPASPNPALYNLPSQGFDVKIIASVEEAQPGWNATSWVVVRKDVWDAGTIRTLADMKGHRMDGGPEGGAGNFILQQALIKAGLKPSDVHMEAKYRNAPNEVEGLRNKEIEIVGSVEPYVSFEVAQNVGVRLASMSDVAPGMQQTILLASGEAIAKNRDGLVRFMKGWIKAAKDITAAGPKWTPDSLKVATKWLGFPEDQILLIPGPPYCGQLGKLNVESLIASQDLYADMGMIEKKIDVHSIIDTSILEEANRA